MFCFCLWLCGSVVFGLCGNYATKAAMPMNASAATINHGATALASDDGVHSRRNASSIFDAQ